MLNRRYLRIKVMQSLYAFFQMGDNDLARGERELMRSVDKAYELYIHLLLVFPELQRLASLRAEDAKNKHLPTAEDLTPNLRFVKNRVITQLSNHPGLKREADARRLNWQRDEDLNQARKIWTNVRNWDGYKLYMASPDDSYQQDCDLVLDIFKRFVADDDDVEQYLEELNMHWPGDLNMAVAPTIIRTFETGTENQLPELQPLLKDEEDDRQFVLSLYRKTILDNQMLEERIGDKTTNWEIDRIAVLDIILMKMAIIELIHFHNIPVKVTLNEYIEISKTYSTPRSKQFINGILDKLVIDLKKESLLVKTGRGLME